MRARTGRYQQRASANASHFTASFSVISMTRAPRIARSAGAYGWWSGKGCGTAAMPHRRELREKARGVADPRERVHAGSGERGRGGADPGIVDAHEPVPRQRHRERAAGNRRRGRFVRNERDDRVDLVQPRYGLAQRAGRQEPAVPRRAGRIHDRDLDVAGQPVVLKAVVREDDVAVRMAGQQVASGCDAIAGDDDGVAGAREEQRLVADTARIVVRRDRRRRAVARDPAVAAADDAGPKAASRERVRERRDERRLAAPAGGDVADDDDRDGEPHRAQEHPCRRACAAARPQRRTGATAAGATPSAARSAASTTRRRGDRQASRSPHRERAPSRHLGGGDWVANVM